MSLLLSMGSTRKRAGEREREKEGYATRLFKDADYFGGWKVMANWRRRLVKEKCNEW